MNCLKCGKEIIAGHNKLCEECSANLASSFPSQNTSRVVPEQSVPKPLPSRGVLGPNNDNFDQRPAQDKPQLNTDFKPPTNSSSGVVTGPTLSTPIANIKKGIPVNKIILIAVLLFIFLGLSGVGVLVFGSYSNWQPPLVSKDIMRLVDVSITSVPVVPKTPKQILTRAIFQTTQINTAYQKIFMNISSKGAALGENLDFTINVEGPFDAKDINNVKYSSDVNGTLKISGQSFNLSFQMIQIVDSVYIKITKVPEILALYGYNFSAVQNKWLKLNMQKLEKESGIEFKTDEEVQNNSDEQISKFLEKVEERGLFNKFKKLKDAKIGGEDSYQLSLELTSEDLKNLIVDFYKESGAIDKNLGNVRDLEENIGQITNLIKDSVVEIWVTKDGFIFNKFDFNTKVVYPTSLITGSLASRPVTLNFHLTYTLEQINKPQEILAPKSYTEVQSLSDLLKRIYKPSSRVSFEQPTSVLGTTTIQPIDILSIPKLIKSIYLIGPAAN